MSFTALISFPIQVGALQNQGISEHRKRKPQSGKGIPKPQISELINSSRNLESQNTITHLKHGRQGKEKSSQSDSQPGKIHEAYVYRYVVCLLLKHPNLFVRSHFCSRASVPLNHCTNGSPMHQGFLPSAQAEPNSHASLPSSPFGRIRLFFIFLACASFHHLPFAIYAFSSFLLGVSFPLPRSILAR